VIIGGTIASMLLAAFDWRAVFIFGSVATLVFLPLAWFLLPESIANLVQRRPRNALQSINATLHRMGHAPISELPAAPPKKPVNSTRALFSKTFARTTILLTAAYFAHIMTFYFTLKWIPKIVVDMGFQASSAGGVLVWANVGGLAGSLLLGLLAQRYNLKAMVIIALVLGAGMVTWFGQEHTGLVQLSMVAAAAGFFSNAAVVGLYALFAQCFPSEVRAGGTGFVIGFGRGGSAVGPIIAGILFSAGAGLPAVALLMALGSLVAAVILLLLKPGEAVY
jgi:predicted MFS family arabinose efflux permease